MQMTVPTSNRVQIDPFEDINAALKSFQIFCVEEKYKVQRQALETLYINRDDLHVRYNRTQCKLTEKIVNRLQNVSLQFLAETNKEKVVKDFVLRFQRIFNMYAEKGGLGQPRPSSPLLGHSPPEPMSEEHSLLLKIESLYQYIAD